MKAFLCGFNVVGCIMKDDSFRFMKEYIVKFRQSWVFVRVRVIGREGGKFTKVLARFHGAKRSSGPKERRNSPAFNFCVQDFLVKGKIMRHHHVC